MVSRNVESDRWKTDGYRVFVSGGNWPKADSGALQSGLEDEAGAFGSVPEFFDVAKRCGDEFDPERAFCGFPKNAAKGFEDFFHGNAPESAADELEAGTTEGGGVQADGGAGAVADLDIAETPGCVVEAFLHDGGEEGFGGWAPKVVEDDVDAVIDLGTKGGDEGFAVLVEGDDGVGTEGFGFFECLGIAADRDNAFRAKATGDLHGEVAGAPGSAEDEDAFAVDEMSAMLKCGPGRHGGVDHGGDDGVIEIGGERRAHSAPGNGALGEGSVGRA